MSNGAVLSTCCCATCTKSCCSWWECSPTDPVSITLTGSSNTIRNITTPSSAVPVQTFAVEEISWSITATLVRSGSACPGTSTTMYRYSADTCHLSYHRKRKTFSVGNRHICNKWCFDPCCNVTVNGDCRTYSGARQLTPEDPCGTGAACGSSEGRYNRLAPDPCFSWNCNSCAEPDCEGWGCKSLSEMEFRHIQNNEIVVNTNLTSSGSGICSYDTGCVLPPSTNCTNNFALAKPGAVITVICSIDCGETCVKPALIFTPGPNFPGTAIVDYTMDPCCPTPCAEFPETCYFSDDVNYCIRPFMILGQGNCFNSSTFSSPTTANCALPNPDVDHASGWGSTELDMCGAGCATCAPLDRTYDSSYCVDTEFEGLYCAAFGELPDAEPGYCERDQTSQICYWPNWCERDYTTVQWGWSLT